MADHRHLTLEREIQRLDREVAALRRLLNRMAELQRIARIMLGLPPEPPEDGE